MIGGTVDIIVHKILDDGTLAEVYKASGGAWGGTVVDKEFKKFVSSLFDNDNCLEELWNLAPMDALDLEREFEAKKEMLPTTARVLFNSPNGYKCFQTQIYKLKTKRLLLLHICTFKRKNFRDFSQLQRTKLPNY